MCYCSWSVPAPEQASTNSPFAKLEDEEFLEYLKEFLVNKSSEFLSAIQDKESSEIKSCSIKIKNLT